MHSNMRRKKKGGKEKGEKRGEREEDIWPHLVH
jgi:hypothetical protein